MGDVTGPDKATSEETAGKPAPVAGEAAGDTAKERAAGEAGGCSWSVDGGPGAASTSGGEKAEAWEASSSCSASLPLFRSKLFSRNQMKSRGKEKRCHKNKTISSVRPGQGCTKLLQEFSPKVRKKNTLLASLPNNS